MDVFTSAAEFLRHRRPERPVLAVRPHAAERAASWFIANFPGRVLYAAKANDAPEIIEALVKAGIRGFDVASLVEIERLAAGRGCRAVLHEPGQVAGRNRARLSRIRGEELRLRQRRRARQDRRGDRRSRGSRALPPRRLSQHAQPHSARGQVRRLGRCGACASPPRAPDRAAGSASPSMSALKPSSPPLSARRFARSAS